MRIRIAFLLALALAGLVSGLATAALMRPPAPTLVAPIEFEDDGDPDGNEGPRKRGDKGKDDRDPDEGAEAVSGPTAVPAGDDDDADDADGDDDNSGPGGGDDADDDDDNSGPGGDDDKDDDNSGPGGDDDGPDDD